MAAARSDSGFVLLDSDGAAFSSRLALIESAEHSLDLQYYAIHADNSTEILFERLRDAARRGVRIRILLDDFNTVGKDAQVLRLDFEPNVEIRLFNPLPGSRISLMARLFTSVQDISQLQKRMHNKLFIADNAMGIAGGRNLGDAYFGTDDKSNFVDLDVLAVGRVVRDMSASFDRYWNDELAYPVQTLMSKKDLEALRKQPAAPGGNPSEGGAQPKPGSPAPSATSSVLPNATPTSALSAEPRAMDLRTDRAGMGPRAGAGGPARQDRPRRRRGGRRRNAGRRPLAVDRPGAPGRPHRFALLRAGRGNDEAVRSDARQGGAHPGSHQLARVERCARRARRLRALSEGFAGDGRSSSTRCAATRKARWAGWDPPRASARARAGGSKRYLTGQPAFQGRDHRPAAGGDRLDEPGPALAAPEQRSGVADPQPRAVPAGGVAGGGDDRPGRLPTSNSTAASWCGARRRARHSRTHGRNRKPAPS